jgi:hypothetical protein
MAGHSNVTRLADITGVRPRVTGFAGPPGWVIRAGAAMRLDARMALDTDSEQKTTGSTGTMRELFLGLIWLGTSMISAHASLTGSTTGPEGVIGAAAAALPGIIAATLVTGASIGHAAGSRFRSAVGRLMAGLGVGAIFGIASAVALRMAYGSTPSISVLAVTVGVASLAGGALAMLPNAVLEAALWATTWVFFAGVIIGVWQITWLAKTSVVDADKPASLYFALAQSLVTGLIAGVYSSRSLRGERAQRGWFVVAGAVPGLFLVGAELLTRAAGASVTKLVAGFSTTDPVLVKLSDTAALRHGVIVLVVGALVAAVASWRADRD